MKMLMIAVTAVTFFATPVRADEPMMTVTPELALPEPDATANALPHSTMTETVPLALPEPETEAAAPFKRCGERETVYLTN